MRLACLLAFALLLTACDPPAAENSDAEPAESADVRTGAQVLADGGFAELAGKRVGLVVNHTALVDTTHLADLLHAADAVTVSAIFGPEHGFRGDADAGAKIDDGTDPRTGVPVYSLYGQTRKPTADMLADVDVLAFDIQDIGARFYTYISTMGLAMQAAAEQGIPFVVLDRPNPLGGEHVEGFLRAEGFESFVGQYPIPITHGMTVGELARMIKGEGLMSGLADLDLRVVEMEGWTRATMWPETGLDWVPPSPNIPTFETALVYAGTCFFEATPTVSEGRGTRTPFTLVGAPWADSDALVATLDAADLPGARFEAAAYTPVSIEGMSSSPKLEGQALSGLRIGVTDVDAYDPVRTGIHILHAFYQQADEATRADFFNTRWMGLLSGSARTEELFAEGASPEAIVAAWQDETQAFRTARTPYLLYD